MSDAYNNAIGPQVRDRRKPSRGKAKPIIAGVSLLAGMSASTQYFARLFEYHEALGSNINHFYAPWSILGWAHTWHTTYPDQVMQAGSVGVVVSGLGLVTLAGYSMVDRKSVV